MAKTDHTRLRAARRTARTTSTDHRRAAAPLHTPDDSSGRQNRHRAGAHTPGIRGAQHTARTARRPSKKARAVARVESAFLARVCYRLARALHQLARQALHGFNVPDPDLYRALTYHAEVIESEVTGLQAFTAGRPVAAAPAHGAPARRSAKAPRAQHA